MDWLQCVRGMGGPGGLTATLNAADKRSNRTKLDMCPHIRRAYPEVILVSVSGASINLAYSTMISTAAVSLNG
jgi:hypothetical protein